MQIGVLEPDEFSHKALEQLATLGDVKCFPGGSICDFVIDKEVLFVRLRHRIDDDLLSCAPRLRVLCSPTTGLTHIDEVALETRGISLISLRGATDFLQGIVSTPEHALMLTLALLRNLGRAMNACSRGEWDRDAHIGTDLRGKRVGVVGMGRVGRQYSAYVTSLGAQVVWSDPNDAIEASSSFERVESTEQVLAKSDMVLLSASWRQGALAIGHDQMALLKDKYFINVARGELIDEDTLLAMTQRGELLGVALDVLQGEPHARNLEAWATLMQSRNVILTPHLGGATFESMRLTEEFITSLLIKSLESSRDQP